MVFVCADGDAERVGKGGSLETLDLGGHCGREEISATLSREDFEDLGYDGTEVC